MQKIISNTCIAEHKRINNKLYKLLDKDLRDKLELLLTKDSLFFQLTNIKKDQKDFSYSEIRSTITKQELLLDIYNKSDSILKELGIAEQNINYYSDLALYYSSYGLKHNIKSKNLVRLYLICYANRRLLKINDHLIYSLIFKVNKFQKAADEYQMKEIYREFQEDKTNRKTVANILSIIPNSKVEDEEIRPKSYEITPEGKFKDLIRQIKNPTLTPDFYRWKYYDRNKIAISRNIRPIFMALEFQSQNQDIVDAINFYREHLSQDNNKISSFDQYKTDEIPINFIPKPSRKWLYNQIDKKSKLINPFRYEFMLYIYIMKFIDNNTISLSKSLSYKSYKDEVLSDDRWENENDEIKDSLKKKLMSIDVDFILDKFDSMTKERYISLNSNINNGLIEDLKIKNKDLQNPKWNLSYKKLDNSVSNPFFGELSMVSISDILRYSDQKTDFTDKFIGILPKYSKNKEVDKPSLYACMTARATGDDVDKMKDISDIDESELEFNMKSYVRYNNLVAGSAKIVNATAKLPIFNEYNLADYGVHASVDGQKFPTKYNVIKARYSSKYYGLGKGISALTLSANHLSLHSKVISPNEYEGHHLFDLVNNNATDIDIKSISGDMHSINKVNFALIYMFGYQFMPRFTNINEKANKNLVAFDNLQNYKDFLIKPSEIANKKDIIRKEWDNLLRIFATLMLKENNQANLIRKLSTNKPNDTMKALIELDKIIMTIYMLDYIGSREKRQIVHRSLVRHESYHQLRSAISRVSGRRIAGKNEIDIIINNECARLIANAIIFYNASILSAIYEYYLKNNMAKESQIIPRLSPVSWDHINLKGKYEFRSNAQSFDLQGLVENMIQNSKIDFEL